MGVCSPIYELYFVNDLASDRTRFSGVGARCRAPRENGLPPERRPEALVRDYFYPQGFKLILQQSNRAEFGIAAEDQANDFYLAVDDAELAVLRRITERRHTAHPPCLLFRGGDLVANALADDLALELREGQQNVQGASAPSRLSC